MFYIGKVDIILRNYYYSVTCFIPRPDRKLSWTLAELIKNARNTFSQIISHRANSYRTIISIYLFSIFTHKEGERKKDRKRGRDRDGARARNPDGKLPSKFFRIIGAEV